MRNSELEQVAERLFSDEQWPQGEIGIDLAKGRLWEVVDGNENDLTSVVRQMAVVNYKAEIKSDDNINLMREIINVVMKDPNLNNLPPGQLIEYILNIMKEAKPGMKEEELVGFKFMFKALLIPSVVQKALERAAQASNCLDTLRALLALNRKKLRAV